MRIEILEFSELEEIKDYYGENTISKALMKLIVDFPDLIKDRKNYLYFKNLKDLDIKKGSV